MRSDWWRQARLFAICYLLFLAPFHLPVLQLYRGRAAEDADRNTQLAAIRINFFNDTALVLKRPVRHFDGFSYLKADLRFNLIFTLSDLGQHTFDLLRSHWYRTILSSGKSEHAWGFTDKIPSPVYQLVLFIQQVHIHDEITW